MKRYHFTNPWKGDYDLSKVEVFMISNENDAAEAMSYLRGEPVLYVDTEGYNRGNPYSQRLALVQVATGPNRCFIFDVVEYRDCLDLLKDVLEYDGTTKVFHGCYNDVAVLYAYGVQLRNVYDTQVAEEEIKPLSGDGINKEYLSCRYSKKYMKTRPNIINQSQMIPECSEIKDESLTTRWFKRPLKEGDVSYATVDVLFLTELHSIQKQEIQDWHAFVARMDKLLSPFRGVSAMPCESSLIPESGIIPNSVRPQSLADEVSSTSSLTWGVLVSGAVAAVVVSALIGAAVAVWL